MPSTLPWSSGSTSPIAFAAPVDVGTRLIAAARARRRSLCGASCRFWSCVYAWIVVMKPDWISPRSCSTFARGATQLVVHDAFETMWCESGSYWSSLTPSTTVMSGSVAGAEMTTFFAPASRCFCAPSRSVKKPVDSSTTSTPRSPQGSAPGSRSESMRISSPAARSVPSASSTSPSNGPSVESYFRRCAIVFASPRSFSATISRSDPSAWRARKKFRPMRPNPLMPTRVPILSSVSRYPFARESESIRRALRVVADADGRATLVSGGSARAASSRSDSSGWRSRSSATSRR